MKKYMKYESDIKILIGPLPGPTLAIFAGVHRYTLKQVDAESMTWQTWFECLTPEHVLV